MDEKRDQNPSHKQFFTAIVVLVLLTIGVVIFYSSRKTKTESPLSPPSSSSITLTPTNITTVAGEIQSFTATYSDTNGWESISDASLYIAGGGHDQWPHYNPATKKFTLLGAEGSCMAGQATTLSTNYLSLNCGASTASVSGPRATITFSLTPKRSSAGIQYRLFAGLASQSGTGNGKFVGTWTIQ